MITLGTAPASWGVALPDDPLQPPWQRFLDEAAEVGYAWCELGPYGYLPTELSVLRRELGGRGLKISSAFAFFDLAEPSAWSHIEKQALKTGELLAGVGGEFFLVIAESYCDLVTDQPRKAARLGEKSWKVLIETTHKLADTLRDRLGLRLAFHPHAQTHVEYTDQVEAFLEETDPDRISLCLDTGHHLYCGGDPLGFLRRHHRRVAYLHLKNTDPAVHSRVAAESILFGAAVRMGVFCEPSKGALDFVALRNLLREIAWHGFAIVEQGMYPAPLDVPLPIARRSLAYLREVGFG